MANFYDQIEVDIQHVHERIATDNKLCGNLRFCTGLIEKVLFRKGLYYKFVDAGFVRGWLEEFNGFWVNALGGRPLRFHDFFFLHSHYRTKFQNVEVLNELDDLKFIHSWQKYENIFLVFSGAYRYALNPFTYLPYKKFLSEGMNVLEYGCGLAPITTSLLRAKLDKFNFTIADIKGFTYAYAKYLLDPRQVEFVDVVPFESPSFKHKFDTVFLMTVLEHLPNPLDVVMNLTEAIKNEGYLVFDYILGDGAGLDTEAGIAERSSVLGYIRDNFDIVHGSLKEQESMGMTVGR